MSIIDELKAAAFESLLLNAGSGIEDWQDIMLSEYADVVMDVAGTDLENAIEVLTDLWECGYQDPCTGIERPLYRWAECFRDEASVEAYYRLVENNKKTRKMTKT